MNHALVRAIRFGARTMITITEGQKIAWVRAQNLRDYPMPPADEPLIPLLQDWL